jgi:hypothetical protein
VYSHTGAISIKNPNYPDAPYLGSTYALHVTPPCHAADVRRHILAQEEIADVAGTYLLTDLSGLTRLEDNAVMDAIDGPGSSSGNPIALMIPDPSDLPIASPNLPRYLGHVQRREGFDYKIIGTTSSG